MGTQFQDDQNSKILNRRFLFFLWILQAVITISGLVLADRFVGNIPIILAVPINIGTFIAIVGFGPQIIRFFLKTFSPKETLA